MNLIDKIGSQSQVILFIEKSEKVVEKKILAQAMIIRTIVNMKAFKY